MRRAIPRRPIRGLLMLLVYLTATWMHAGHTLMIHLAVYDISPSELNRGLAHVKIGVPIPESADLTNLGNIVLLGAEFAQFQPMSHWPNGSVRWLLVDALVDLPIGQRRTALHLTTGQAAEESGPLLIERESEIAVETGAVSFVIPKNGAIDLHQFAVGNTTLPGLSIRLATKNQPAVEMTRTVVTIEKSGPVTAVVVVEDAVASVAGPVVLRTRITAYRGQSLLRLEVSAYLQASGTNTVSIPAVNLAFAGISDERTEGSGASDRTWYQHRFRAGDHEFLVFHKVDGSSNERVFSENERFMRVLPAQDRAITLRPGSLIRRELFLDLLPDEESVTRLTYPLLGKAVSTDTYNDAETLVERIVAGGQGRSEDDVNADDSFGAIQRSLYEILGNSDPASVKGFVDLRPELDALLSESAMMRSLPGEAVSLWYFLTGDEAVRSAYLDWGEWFKDQLRAGPERQDEVESIAQVLDLYRVTGAEETRNWIWNRVEDWFAKDGVSNDSLRLRASKSGRPLLVLISNLLRHARFDETIEDRLLDILERLVNWNRIDSPSDRVFSEGYALTGNPNFMRDGAEFLADEAYTGPKTSLQYLLAASDRHYVWRELPIHRLRELNGTVSLLWTVPPRAERLRIKRANVPIVFDPDSGDVDSIPFHAARNLDGEPALLASGEEQTLQIPFAAIVGEQHFAARYLERGVALPASTPIRPMLVTTTPQGGFEWSSRMLILAFAPAVLVVAFILKLRGRKNA
ncbi:MAG: hypothetical protein O2960_16585 [Verrucomicrobia bacterium]|nr:hypothetical protein [Verrucomicrobiota bacterium]